MCAGDGVDTFEATRNVLLSIFSGNYIWTIETSCPLNEVAISTPNGGSLQLGIDFILCSWRCQCETAIDSQNEPFPLFHL